MSSAVSTRNLATLGNLETVERLSQSIALLDAILSPKWEYRFFSFNAAWDPRNHERMASMRNGSGDEYFAVFSQAGAILKGFAHECPMSPWLGRNKAVWPGVIDQVPSVFATFLTEPAFSIEDTTFCVWRTRDGSGWKCGHIEFPSGDDPDGSEGLLWMLDADPLTYQAFAQEYYERQVRIEFVRRIYDHTALTRELAHGLNENSEWIAIEADAREIGYPVG